MVFPDFMNELSRNVEIFGAYREKAMPDRCRIFRNVHLHRSFTQMFANSDYKIDSSTGKAATRYFYVASVLTYGTGFENYTLNLNKEILSRKKSPSFVSTEAEKRALSLLEGKSGMHLPSSHESWTVYDALLLEWTHEAIARSVARTVNTGASGDVESIVDSVLGNFARSKFFLNYNLIRFLVAGLGCNTFTSVDDFWLKSPEMGADLMLIFRLRREGNSSHSALAFSFAKICKARKAELAWIALDPAPSENLGASEGIVGSVESEAPALVLAVELKVPVPRPSHIRFDPFGKSFDMNQIGRCPTPLKLVHVTMERAREYIAEVHADDLTIEPYKCICGGIHIGHPSALLKNWKQ